MRNLKKILALTLAFVLVLALGATAFAADDLGDNAFVSISCDGREVYSTSRIASGSADIKTLGPDTLTELRVNDENISLSALEDSLHTAQTRYVNGYNAVDGTYRIYTETVNNMRIARIYWSGLRTSLYVDATSGYMDSYQVRASAEPAGAVKITGDGTAEVAAESSWSSKFTTVSNRQYIKSMYVLVDGTGRDVVVPANGSLDVSVNGQDMRITRNADDSVSVSIARVLRNVSITANAYNSNVENYKLNVVTDRYTRSSLESDTLVAGTTRNISLTPVAGYVVSNIRIMDGNDVGTLTLNQNSVKVNGKIYGVSRKSDGSAVLSVPGINADVRIEVSSSVKGYIVEVLGEKYVSSTHPGLNVIPYGEGFTVTFQTRNQAYYTGLEITTARGTFTASIDDDRIVVSGESFRIYRNVYGDVTLYIDRVPCDMTIAPTSREVRPGSHKIVATTDRYVKANAYDTWVYDGDDVSVTFALTDKAADDAIRQIRVDYNGKTYWADPANEDYITVGGMKWKLGLNSRTGSVTVYMTDVYYDVEVYASVTEKGESNGSGHNTGAKWTIKKTTDSHSTISYTGSAPFANGDETTVRVYTDNNYIIKSVTFTMSGKTATIVPFDSQFTLNGDIYPVKWTTNGDVSVDFPTLTSNMTVKAVSVKGTLAKPDGSSLTGDDNKNDNVTIPTPPTQIVTPPTTTPIEPPTNVNAYHAAFMYGFGDGTFRPDQIMTRAEALAVLSRVHAGLNDQSAKQYATGAAGFIDVGMNEWYAGYVGYAKQQGYLNNVLGGGAVNFNPNQGITRAEFVVLLCNYTNQNTVGTSTVQTFQDVPSTHWAYTFINYCASRGWALGYDGTNFHPDECLTRAQICALVNRINNRAAGNTSGYMANQFLDVAATAWYFNDVMEATNEHYVSGTSNGAEVWVR